MTHRPLPGRVAYRPLRTLQIHPAVERPTFRACGPSLPTATQIQVTHYSPRCCGEYKRFPARPEGDCVVLISLNVADERLTIAHRAKLAHSTSGRYP